MAPFDSAFFSRRRAHGERGSRIQFSDTPNTGTTSINEQPRARGRGEHGQPRDQQQPEEARDAVLLEEEAQDRHPLQPVEEQQHQRRRSRLRRPRRRFRRTGPQGRGRPRAISGHSQPSLQPERAQIGTSRAPRRAPRCARPPPGRPTRRKIEQHQVVRQEAAQEIRLRQFLQLCRHQQGSEERARHRIRRGRKRLESVFDMSREQRPPWTAGTARSWAAARPQGTATTAATACCRQQASPVSAAACERESSR